MKQSYYTDAGHHYLVLECPDRKAQQNYQYRMLTSNRIEGLLPCTRLFTGDEAYLYYDITSRQNLKNLYEARRITGQELTELLFSLTGVSKTLSDYLLDFVRISKSPEDVYYDFFRNRYEFLYYPGEDRGETLQELFLFLADRIDTEDRQATAGIYRLAELSAGQNFLMTEDMLRELFPDTIASQEPAPAEAEEAPRTWDGYDTAENLTENAAVQSDESDGLGLWGRNKDEKTQETEEQTEVRGKASMIIMIAAVGCLVAGGGLEWARRNIALSGNLPFILLVLVVILLTAAIALSGIGTLLSLRRDRSREEEGEEKEREAIREAELEEPRYRYDIPIGNPAEVLRDEPARYVTGAGRKSYEETYYPEEAPSKLHGMGEARAYHIDLEELPCAVGRADRFADYVIEDPSVSSLHARFTRSGDAIMLEDLGSMNGTWLNGERLKSGVRKAIYPGDEVRIGRMQFSYR